ncbi:hypothetical protein [Calothrix sp. 336/3]|uniref:hypothetical protein n=1 Tax=Calothrix sp. 336/3 TaxID=1337936 RepID=UPI000AD2824A|nr:hypothetical protein [Calothrix sp. 336/3]
MTNLAADPNKQQKTGKKKQQSFPPVNIGSPRVPLRQRPKQQQQEVLSDWEHAS